MDKHAYLIIAHNEFEILKLQVVALDDERNDIYIHFDAKCCELPLLECTESNLYILPDRIDVRWGDYSQIETELLLFEYAHEMQSKKGISYQYYHLISGVDIPLKSQDYIHDFFNRNNGKEFLGFYQGNFEMELRKKVQMYYLFPKHFSKTRKFNLRNIVRALFCRFQFFVGYRRNKDIDLVRGTNWTCITNDFVEFLLSKKKEIYRRFSHTFCADEVYKHTLCWNSSFKDRIYNSNNEAFGCMREINWVIKENESFLPSFTMCDYKRLKDSPMLFARKFDSTNIDIVERLLSEL
jgi:hypothetical protein